MVSSCSSPDHCGAHVHTEYYTQWLAIAKEVRDQAGEGRAYGSLGNAYQLQGAYAKAIEYYTQCLAIAKEVGDRAAVTYY